LSNEKIVATSDVYGWLTSLIVATALVLLPLPSWLIDQVYSRAVYPALQTCLTGLTNLVPFSLLDLLILTSVFVVLWRIGRLLGNVKTHGVLRVAWEGVRRTIRVTATLVIVFMVAWGLNYRRTPMGGATGPAPTPAKDQLLAVMADVNVLAARLRDSHQVDMSFDAVAAQLREPMNHALNQLERIPLSQPARPKFSFMLTPFFTWTGVDGMIDPLALESIVHPDLLPFERPYALAHEWAHLAGMADEAEASAIGWLACMNGPPNLAYSASLYLLREAGAALPETVRADAFSRLDPGVRSDLVAIAERLTQERPKVQRAAYEIYDEYLKANHVRDGAASYARALTLILASPIHEALVNYRSDRRDRTSVR
jgi:hypothetical protein